MESRERPGVVDWMKGHRNEKYNGRVIVMKGGRERFFKFAKQSGVKTDISRVFFQKMVSYGFRSMKNVEDFAPPYGYASNDVFWYHPSGLFVKGNAEALKRMGPP